MTTWELQAKIHNTLKNNIITGMTETEVADVISSVLPDWQGDLISGIRTARIEGGPTDKVISAGDVILFDLQVKNEGMWSDITRVYFAGEPSTKQAEAYAKVKDAIAKGEALLCPGTKGKEIYESMKMTIGSEYAFKHHAGHLVNSDYPCVKPSFYEYTEDVLTPGMVVTLEPGIYYPGEFGIRLENNYLITDNGFETLGDLSLDISDYILKG